MFEKLESDFKILKNGPEKYWKQLIQKIVEELQWQYSIHDYDVNRKSFDYTIYFAIEKETDKVVGAVSLTKIPLINQCRPRHLSIIGTFYVLPEYRNRNLGLWLFQTMLKDATDDKFLTGAPEMWQKYRDRQGFDKIADYWVDYLSASHLNMELKNLKKDEKLKIVDWNDADYDEICAYDAKISKCDRQKYLANTFGHPACIGNVAVNEKNKIVGMCRVRLIINDHIDVGPLYADDTLIASSLLRYSLECLLDKYGSQLNAESQIFYKIPSANSASLELFQNLIGDAKLEKTSCMIQFTKELLDVPKSMVYSYSEATSMSTS